jgi:hypothetical protein
MQKNAIPIVIKNILPLLHLQLIRLVLLFCKNSNNIATVLNSFIGHSHIIISSTIKLVNVNCLIKNLEWFRE